MQLTSSLREQLLQPSVPRAACTSLAVLNLAFAVNMQKHNSENHSNSGLLANSLNSRKRINTILCSGDFRTLRTSEFKELVFMVIVTCSPSPQPYCTARRYGTRCISETQACRGSGRKLQAYC